MGGVSPQCVAGLPIGAAVNFLDVLDFVIAVGGFAAFVILAFGLVHLLRGWIVDQPLGCEHEYDR